MRCLNGHRTELNRNAVPQWTSHRTKSESRIITNDQHHKVSGRSQQRNEESELAQPEGAYQQYAHHNFSYRRYFHFDIRDRSNDQHGTRSNLQIGILGDYV